MPRGGQVLAPCGWTWTYVLVLRTKVPRIVADKDPMSLQHGIREHGESKPRELKRLVDAGGYEPDAGRVAEAMLRRRGVRELLYLGLGSPIRADRIRAASSAHHRAA